MSSKRMRFSILVLVACLVITLFLDGYLYFKLVEKEQTREHHSTFFSFVFGPTMQNMTAGNLYLNLTFDTVEGNLTVKAEVNADSYNPDAVLALQFDSDNNGTIDIREGLDDKGMFVYYYFYRFDDLQFLLEANNLTLPSVSAYWGWLSNGTIDLARSPPFCGWAELGSTFHFCTFENEVYTFFFSFPIEPKAKLFFDDGPYGIQGKFVRVLFAVVPTPGSTWYSPSDGMSVYVPPFKFAE